MLSLTACQMQTECGENTNCVENENGANYTCVCQDGYILEDGKCIGMHEENSIVVEVMSWICWQISMNVITAVILKLVTIVHWMHSVWILTVVSIASAPRIMFSLTEEDTLLNVEVRLYTTWCVKSSYHLCITNTVDQQFLFYRYWWMQWTKWCLSRRLYLYKHQRLTHVYLPNWLHTRWKYLHT